jgi:hypothetical protein
MRCSQHGHDLNSLPLRSTAGTAVDSMKGHDPFDREYVLRQRQSEERTAYSSPSIVPGAKSSGLIGTIPTYEHSSDTNPERDGAASPCSRAALVVNQSEVFGLAALTGFQS